MTKNRHLLLEDKSSGLVVLKRVFKLGFSNFLRNWFLSAATIVVMAIILFIFNTILAMNALATQAIQNVSRNVDLVIYLRDDITDTEAENVTGLLKRIEGVKSVRYTSKEEGLADMAKRYPETVEFLKKNGLPNPLPPRLSIVALKPEDYQNIQKALETNEIGQFLRDYAIPETKEESEILHDVGKNLLNIQSFVRQIIFWVILVFVIGGTLVVINAIQLTIYTRRQEVYIMKLVGATPNFIRLPFLFEGILYSVASVLGSFLFLYLLGNSIQIESSYLWSLYSNLRLERIFLIELLMTITIGLISSTSAVEQYLKGNLTARS